MRAVVNQHAPKRAKVFCFFFFKKEGFPFCPSHKNGRQLNGAPIRKKGLLF